MKKKSYRITFSLILVYSLVFFLGACREGDSRGELISAPPEKNRAKDNEDILSVLFPSDELLLCTEDQSGTRKTFWALDTRSSLLDELLTINSPHRISFISGSSREYFAWREFNRPEFEAEHFFFSPSLAAPLNMEEEFIRRNLEIPFLYFSAHALYPVHILPDTAELLYFVIDSKATNLSMSTKSTLIIRDLGSLDIVDSLEFNDSVNAIPVTIVPTNEDATQFILPLNFSNMDGPSLNRLGLIERNPLRVIDELPMSDNTFRVKSSSDDTEALVYRWGENDDIAIDSVRVHDSKNEKDRIDYETTINLSDLSSRDIHLSNSQVILLPEDGDEIQITTAQRHNAGNPPLASIQRDTPIEDFVINEAGTRLVLWFEESDKLELWNIEEFSASMIDAFSIREQ